MSDSEYQQRLKDWVESKVSNTGLNYSGLAAKLGVSRTTISDWRYRPLKTELQAESIEAMAALEGCAPQQMRHWLRTGEWLSGDDAKSEVEKLADRVTGLERKLAQRLSQVVSTPNQYRISSSSDALQEMTVLGMEMQNALAEKNVDWRCLSTIQAMHAFTELPQSQGGLNASPAISLRRFQEILWGQSLPDDDELPEIKMIMYCYTGDHDRWTWEYIKALVKRQYHQSSHNRSNRAAATK
ncbi:MAG: hypothetical protein AAFX78_18530 [Cyanobacteria bacterium J06638_20]